VILLVCHFSMFKDCQSNVFIGCVPEHKICVGRKNLHWSIMKCNGLFGIFSIKTSIGRRHILPTAPPFPLVPPAMRIGRQLCGTIWLHMLTNCLNIISITNHPCSFHLIDRFIKFQSLYRLHGHNQKMQSSIHTFDPFNLQQGSNKEWHVKVQRIIYYGESRFRQAAATMIQTADNRRQRWMQQLLQQELVSQ
jgi:hypothetical protein